jgi:hypothetical protein
MLAQSLRTDTVTHLCNAPNSVLEVKNRIWPYKHHRYI